MEELGQFPCSLLYVIVFNRPILKAPFWVLVVETYPSGTARLAPRFANAEPPERLYKVLWVAQKGVADPDSI